MERYHLLAYSRFNHQEGYFDLALQKLVERFGSTIQTTFDDNFNQYLIISEDDFELIRSELEKKALREEISEVGSFRLINALVKKQDIHRVIQEQDGEQLKYTINLN